MGRSLLVQRLARARRLVIALAAVGCVRGLPHSVDRPIRVMTYNIQSGHGNLDGTAAAIGEQSPDIVALQEVDVHWADRSDFADQATLLGEKLQMGVRFARIYRILNADA